MNTHGQPGLAGRLVSRREMIAVVGAATVGSIHDAASSARAASARGKLLRMEARPEAFVFDPARTAVIVVDMQNDFGAKGGMFDRAGIDISMIQAAVAPTRATIASARDAGIRIVYLKMGYRPDLSDLGGPDAPNRVRHLKYMRVGEPTRSPDGRDSRILVRDTWNTDVLPALAPAADDTVLYKTRFSGFYETELDAILKRKDIKSLVFTGCTTSICVESTVRDAMFRDYQCVLLEDCMGEPIGYGLPRSNHEASLLAIQVLFGWVSSSPAFMARVPA
jgi:ureidoacrylate peracid hydrolase